MIENTLVKGGTGNILDYRADEKASELTLVDQKVVDEVTKKFNEAESIDQVIEVLDTLIELGINFAGSRGYVYMSDAMKYHIQEWHGLPYYNLTRSCGLRQAVIRLS